MSKSNGYPLCYIGPDMKGIKHGTVLKDRESVFKARSKYRADIPFDEFLVPVEKHHIAEKQIREKTGAYYVLTKSVKGVK